MVNKPKAIGTAAETAVVRWLRANGFPGAERRALKGTLDEGDVTGCGPLVVEIKGGAAAKTASDAQVAAWLAEALTEAGNAGVSLGVLVMQRAGHGPANAGNWWAVLRALDLALLVGAERPRNGVPDYAPVRLHLSTLVTLLRAAGYGDPLAEAVDGAA